MKTLIQAPILVLAIALFSCNPEPKTVAKNFSENLSKGKTEKAKKYATEATGNMIDMALGLGLGNYIDPDFKFKPIKDSIANNQAWVTFKDSSKEKSENQIIRLIRIDGKWLVQM